MATRTSGALAMRPAGNSQGGYYCYSLDTGRILNRNWWTVLPMPNAVKQRVTVLAKNSDAGVTFTDRIGNPYLDLEEDDDPDYVDDESVSDTDLDSISGVDDDELDDLAEDTDLPDPPVDDNEDYEDGNEAEENEVEIEAPPELLKVEDDEYYDSSDDEEEDDDEQEPDDEPEPDEPDAQLEQTKHMKHAIIKLSDFGVQTELQTGRTRQQTRRATVQVNRHDEPTDMRKHLKAQQKPGVTCPIDHHPELAHLEEMALTQMSMNKGIKAFGKAGIDAVQKELKQLHDRAVMKPTYADEMTKQERRASLQYLMYLKKKRCGTIKGRGCADGRKQRKTTRKEDASSPTVSIESLMISCTIDAHEGRDVATADIPGAFMQADMDEMVHVRLEGTMAELLVKLDPKLYRKYIRMENGKAVLYVELLKALYGTLRAALLFWRKLSGFLVEAGFKINPYDWCVANKTINGKQCTILWHVDDLKISHVDTGVVDGVLATINNEFGKETPITVTRGKVHDYLGMTLDFTKPGKVMIKMLEYIDSFLEQLPTDINVEASTLTVEHLFTVNDEPKKLD